MYGAEELIERMTQMAVTNVKRRLIGLTAVLMFSGTVAVEAAQTRPASATPVKVASAKAATAAPATVDFARDSRPIISANCFACHGPDEGSRVAGIRLDVRAEAMKDRGGVRSITPGKPAASRVYLRIAEREPARRMPPPGSGH